MAVAGGIDGEGGKNLEALFMRGLHNEEKLGKGPQTSVGAHPVRKGMTAVARKGLKGAVQQDPLHPQTDNVIHSFKNAPKIPHSIPRSVKKTADVNFVKDSPGDPELCIFHRNSSEGPQMVLSVQTTGKRRFPRLKWRNPCPVQRADRDLLITDYPSENNTSSLNPLCWSSSPKAKNCDMKIPRRKGPTPGCIQTSPPSSFHH